MIKIAVLGGSGMLGSTFRKVWVSTSFQVTYTYSDSMLLPVDFASHETGRMFNARHGLPDVREFDYVINCIGVIKPHIQKNIADAVYVNSVFPHLLAERCKEHNAKLIHITTDCVFSGKAEAGIRYFESSVHDAGDDYGKSKSLGEPKDLGMVLRTSIIGEEVNHRVSLVEWAKLQRGNAVDGYVNHWWNGVTCIEFVRMCTDIIAGGLWVEGLFHIFSPITITKADLLGMLNNRFELGLQIHEVYAKPGVNRALGTAFSLNSILKVRPIEEQIETMIVKP